MTRASGIVLYVCIFMVAMLGACATSSAPPTRDGLVLVERPGLNMVYVRPGLSLAKYRRVMLDPVDVSFAPNWDPRGSRVGFDTADPLAIRQSLARLAREVFQRELTRGGYQIATEPGDDVLRVHAAIVNLYINGPETNTAGIVHTYVLYAGEMTLVADLYDSQTNALLAHVEDRERSPEYSSFQMANRATNTAAADRILTKWADRLRAALDRAKTESSSAGH